MSPVPVGIVVFMIVWFLGRLLERRAHRIALARRQGDPRGRKDTSTAITDTRPPQVVCASNPPMARRTRSAGPVECAPLSPALLAAPDLAADVQRGRELTADQIESLRASFEDTKLPQDVLRDPVWTQAAWILNRHCSQEALEMYLNSSEAIDVILALHALAQRSESMFATHRILRVLDHDNVWLAFFCLRVLQARVPAGEPIIGQVLMRCPDLWAGAGQSFLESFIRARVEGGESVSPQKLFGPERPVTRQHQNQLMSILKRTCPDLVDSRSCGSSEQRRGSERLEEKRVCEAVTAGESMPGDGIGPPEDRPSSFSFGRLWSVQQAGGAHDFVEHDGVRGLLERLTAVLAPPRRASVILSGEDGAGKTHVLRACLRRSGDAWRLLEVTPEELIAGRMYIGQLEEGIRELVAELGGCGRTILYLPRMEEFLWTGRHLESPLGVLDYLLRHIETGQIAVVGETDPRGLDLLCTRRPRIRSAFRLERVGACSRSSLKAIASARVQRWQEREKITSVEDGLLEEAIDLAAQYLARERSPGDLVHLLDLAIAERDAGDAAAVGPVTLCREDLLQALQGLTGLAGALLDEEQSLDLEHVRTFFSERILGQPEAIECLVERVGLIKAGLVDSGRPLGVFLFAGPTGTGKTEIAKVLTEYLFGSANRLLRVDMSELLTIESVGRLFGPPSDGHSGDSLVERVRRRPFSVILLDEFEKAPPEVWNYFLQVFDAGRLCDHQGRATDFRHTLIIMTSNLGSSGPARPALGFVPGRSDYRPAEVAAAVRSTFPRELLNRMDQVVVFRPFGRQTMRAILGKELRAAAQRRGLRRRNWHIDWEESALNFILERGITPDLGARPLRKAIERYFLAPLARHIACGEPAAAGTRVLVRGAGARLELEFTVARDETSLASESVGRENSPALTVLRQRPRADPPFLPGRGRPAAAAERRASC